MGKGDQKSTRGKRKAGSFGKTRQKKSLKSTRIPVKDDSEIKGVKQVEEELKDKQKTEE